MAGIDVTTYTDPACPSSWAAQPAMVRMLSEFDAQVRVTYVMAGLAPKFPRVADGMARAVLDAGIASRMPVDPRLWLDGPPRSSHPACIAVHAAAEQGLQAPVLRVLREGFMVHRQVLDTPQALVNAARTVPGLDAERFRLALASSATVEALGADRERFAAAAVPCGTILVPGAVPSDGSDWRALRQAVLAAGAQPGAAMADVQAAVRQHGPCASAEVGALCGMPLTRVAAELWRLAGDLVLTPVKAGTGVLWQAAG